MIDDAFLSHVLLWIIGAMSAAGVVLTVLALFSLGRSGYRKD